MQCVRLGLELALLIYEFEHKVLWEPFCLFYIHKCNEHGTTVSTSNVNCNLQVWLVVMEPI